MQTKPQRMTFRNCYSGIIFQAEEMKLQYVPDEEDSHQGEQKAPQDPEPGQDVEPEPEQNKEANLVLEAAEEQDQDHGLD